VDALAGPDFRAAAPARSEGDVDAVGRARRRDVRRRRPGYLAKALARDAYLPEVVDVRRVEVAVEDDGAAVRGERGYRNRVVAQARR
jgi:hypothetical protein